MMVLLWILCASLAFSTCKALRLLSTVGERPKTSIRLQDSILDTAYSFSELKALEERVRKLSIHEREYISSFWNEDLCTFSIYPNLKATRPSMLSTCFCIQAMLCNPVQWKGSAAWDATTSNAKQISVSKAIKSLKEATWTFDPFQTPVLISTLCRTKSIDIKDKEYLKAVETILSQRSKLSLHRQQDTSAYLRYLNVKALLDILAHEKVPTEILGTNRISFALERASIISFDELCRQMAFYEAGDQQNFCVIILAYSTLTYYESTRSLFSRSFDWGVLSETAGIPATTNIKLIKKALELIFQCQATDGTWRKGEPIFNPADSGSDRTSSSSSSSSSSNIEPSAIRDIGNSYVFFFDMVSSMLNTLAEKDASLLSPYLNNLGRCLQWAEGSVMKEILKEDCNVATNRCRGSVVSGWRSNHLGPGSPAAWSTAHVFLGLSGMRNLLRSLVTKSILEEFGGRELEMISTREWETLMDADILLGSDRTSTLKDVVATKVLEPLVSQEEAATAHLLPADMNKPMKMQYQKPYYSLILFGPPGTAKTTICTSMANYLGWNFVTIDTADFLADGFANVASRMTYIFDRLKVLERTIILFDEVEEFCLDRENPALSMESRMLTTAMLTQFNDLRRQQSSVFIVATNRIRSFDTAVTRPGRFDSLLFVGTPNLNSREKRLKSRFMEVSSHLTPRQQSDVITAWTSFMRKHWQDKTRYLTFAENESLMNTVIENATNDISITSEFMEDQLNDLMRTSTIQGNIREEYKLNELMSRIQ